MTVGLSSLISLTHHCYDWHPRSHCGWTCNQLTSKVDGGITGSRLRWSNQFSPSVRPHNPATGFRPHSATVVSAEPFSHGTETLRCLQKEIATYRHWSVSLWRDPDDVAHCRILSRTKLNGGLSRLNSADEDAVSWLTSYGSWHAYEKKKLVLTLLNENWHIFIISDTLTKNDTFRVKLTVLDVNWQYQTKINSFMLKLTLLNENWHLFFIKSDTLKMTFLE